MAALAAVVGLVGCGGQGPRAGPAFPPEDGRLILTVAEPDPVGEYGQNDVFSMSGAGDNLRRLTRTSIDEIQASISPDGRYIAFGRNASNTSRDAFLMRVKDRKTIRLTRTAEVNELPKGWSPDGRYLSVLQGPEQLGDGWFNSLWIYDLHSGDRKKIATSEEQISGGAWSPDGSVIVYSAQLIEPPGNLNWEVFTIRPDGTHRTRLTYDPEDDLHADWAPNGKQLAFVRGVLDLDLPPTQLWVMDADGSRQRRLYAPRRDRDIQWLAWSPDGGWIAFVEKSYTMGRTSDVWKIRVSGGRPRRVTERMEVGSLDWHTG